MRGLIWCVGLLVVAASMLSPIPATAGRWWTLLVLGLLWILLGLGLAASAAFRLAVRSAKAREGRPPSGGRGLKPTGDDNDDDAD